MSSTDIRIDGERLWSTIEQVGRVGAIGEGGVCRLALTDEDAAARELVLGWAAEAGCQLRTDAIGNAFARRAGADPARGAVIVGSHLDSQPSGGRFDGALGVLAGLEIIRTLHEHRVSHHAPVELAIWTDEEGARFDVSCVGSGVYAGQTSLEDAYRLTDADGVSVHQELERLGWLGSTIPGTPRPDAYFEVHIEQGPVLERLGVPLAVVRGVTGIRWIEVTLTGSESHAGTTPYAARRDALLAAARLTVEVDALARRRPPDARATVCVISAAPNSGSVIAGRSRLLVDLRHPDAQTLDQMEAELTDQVRALKRAGFEVSIRSTWSEPPVAFDRDCVSLLRGAAINRGLQPAELVSGAGHDAAYLALVAPAAMLFVPCREGISHNPRESAEPEHVRIATDVLLDAVLTRAGPLA